MVIRPYTPCSEPDAVGHFDLVIKVYPTGATSDISEHVGQGYVASSTDCKWPSMYAGVMSKHIGGLNVGDTLECKGPVPKLKYEANMKKAVGMVRSH